MRSGTFLDDRGQYDDYERSRDEVLVDTRMKQLLEEENPEIDDRLSINALEEHLRDDTIYFVNKNYYHTWDNVDQDIAHKVDAGPNNEGRAGDLDVGRLHIPSGKLTKIELKKPGRIPPRTEREALDRRFDPVKHGEEQNEYLGRLLDNLEQHQELDIPYSSEVEAWNDVVEEGIENIYRVPAFSQNTGYSGGYIASQEALERAERSETVQRLNESLFKGWMLGGGENILENMK